jgi:protoporphyrinogen oxidase
MGKILLGRPAARIFTEAGRVTGVETIHGHHRSRSRHLDCADTLCVRLVPDLPEAARQQYDAIPNIGICCLVFKLKRSLSPHFWINFSEPGIEIPGLIEFSNLREVGSTIVYVPYYMPTTHEKLRWSDERLLDEAFTSMRAIQPLLDKNDIIDSRVARLRYAQPICGPDFASRLPSVQTSIEGLQIADTCFYYPEDRGIAESVRLGRQMARNICQKTAASGKTC